MHNARLSIALAVGLFISGGVFAQTIESGFDSNSLTRHDDYPSALADIGFEVNFYGQTFDSTWVNNNGNITFGTSLSTYTPFDLTSTSMNIIAPFFSDVDTSYAGSVVTYGQGTFDGQAAFGVNWLDVDYYYSDPSHTARDNFQLILVDRSEGTGNGDFDIVFNYGSIQWETGEASYGDVNGLGGYSARVGYSNGTGDAGTFYELPGSAENGAFLDGGPYALNGLRYVFEVRNGIVSDPIPSVPEPETWAMLLAGLGIVGAVARRKRSA